MPAELEKLETLYASAFALIHPTSLDLQPLVISEAGYFGCPSITARSFGIPELIEDGVTGFLCRSSTHCRGVCPANVEALPDKAKYLSMRRAVRTRATNDFTWQVVGNRIVAEMRSALSEARGLDIHE